MPWKILIVDDDADLRVSLATLFEMEGFVVDEAEDGAMALGHALAHLPDLVVLDLNLPRVEGPDVLRGLRAVPLTATLPVVVVSAELRAYQHRLKGLKYDAAIRKPCEPGELLQTVRRALRVAA